MFLAADGGAQVRTTRDKFAVRFHLHPTVKATRLTDGHGAMLMTPNKEVWTFSAREDRVELEDSVYLAGSEGPRRTIATGRLRPCAHRRARGLEPAAGPSWRRTASAPAADDAARAMDGNHEICQLDESRHEYRCPP